MLPHTRSMTAPPVRLGFFKLNVPEMEPALAFWREAFGFQVAMSFEEPDFAEHVLALPGQELGPNLMLVEFKDRRDVAPSPGQGPVGLVCDDIAASHERALACGAEVLTGVFEAAGVKIALLRSPQGHEIELVQLPG
jgi:lactoylglutathione lyase